MAHAAKYTKSASGHLAAHYERRKVKDPKTGEYEYVKFGNQDIDPSRTHMNYNLAPDREGGQMAFLRQRLSEVKVLNRADVNVMCSWVVTLPKFECVMDGIHVTPNKDRISELFFERSYQFMADRYGEENVISAYVHRDETEDHMHFAFIPVMEDLKNGGEKVCAKKVLSRTDLQSFHTDLERHLDSFHDWHFEVLNGATKEGNKAIAELKQETAIKELQAQQQAAAQKIQELQMQVEREEAAADRRKDAIAKEISELEQKRDGIMSSMEVADLEGRRTLTGGLKGVTYAEFEALKRTAEKVDEMTEKLAEANARADSADQRVALAVAAANAQLKERVNDANAQLDSLRKKDKQELAVAKSNISWELSQLRQENQILKAKVSRLEQAVDYLKDVIRQKLPEMVKTMESRVKQLLSPAQGRDR